MSNTPDSPNPDPLSRQLAAWRVRVEVPARFQAGVWARIAALESAPSLWERAAGWLGAFLPVPRAAAVAVSLGLLLGVGAAFLQTRGSLEETERRLEARYLETINPLAHAGHASS